MLFIETPEFTRHLPAHLDDESYAALQSVKDDLTPSERAAWRRAVEAIQHDKA